MYFREAAYFISIHNHICSPLRPVYTGLSPSSDSGWLHWENEERNEWECVFYFQTSSLGETRSHVKFLWLNKCRVWLFLLAYTRTKRRCVLTTQYCKYTIKTFSQKWHSLTGICPYAHVTCTLVTPVPPLWLTESRVPYLSDTKSPSADLDSVGPPSSLTPRRAASVCVLFSYTFLIV